MSYQSVELIIWPRWMILMTAENQVMENKGIVIDAGQILTKTMVLTSIMPRKRFICLTM